MGTSDCRASCATAPKRVAVIGLGAMGGAMARRLVQAGFRVTGCDLDARAGARLAHHGGQMVANAALAAADASVLIVMVHDQSQVERVLFGPEGAVPSLPVGATVWLASTVPPAYVRSLASRLAMHGVQFVDGPVSGGATGAEAGKLTVIAAGATAALAACAGVMGACAQRVLPVGDVGAASTIKAINQVLVAAHVALTAEALCVAERAGVDLAQLVDVISASAGSSRMFEKRAPRMAAADHLPHTTLATLDKDLRIALELAHALGVPMPLAESAHLVFLRAASAGRGGDSDTLLLDAYRAWSRAAATSAATA